MNRIDDQLEQLAACARRESAPVGDVTNEVMRRLRIEKATVPPAPLTLFAAGYAAIATAALVFGVSLFNLINDPLAAMFEFGMGITP